jgi:hypothetical protein
MHAGANPHSREKTHLICETFLQNNIAKIGKTTPLRIFNTDKANVIPHAVVESS